MEIYRVSNQKRKQILVRKYHVTLVRTYKKQFLKAPKSLFNIYSQNRIRCFQLKATYLDKPWLTTLLEPWTSEVDLTMWTLASVKTDLDGFLGPKWIPIPWRQSKKAKFCRRKNFATGEADFNHLLRQINQAVVAADNLLKKKFVSSSSIYTIQRHG